MKLQEIDYNTGVQASDGADAQMGEAQAAAAGTFEKGLHAFGSELVKSQHNRAAADLLGGLEDAQLDLRSQKTISTSQLRIALGSAFDSLPAEIKAQTYTRKLNSATGEYEDTDRQDIPMFAVAGHIYDVRARKLLADSAAQFSSQGWAADFQEQAQHEVLAQRMKLSERTMHDAHEYLQEQTLSSAIDAANAGNPKAARQILSTSRTLDPKVKLEAEGHIEKIEQTRPLYEALRTGNIGAMAEMLPALGDAKQFTKLNEEERVSFTHRFQAEIKGFQEGLKKGQEDQLHRTAERGWNGIFAKERAGQPVSYGDIPMPGTVKAEAQKEMIGYVDKLNKGEKPETDWTLYAGLLETAHDRQKFGNIDFLKYRNKLADSEFKQLLELQQGMKGGNPEAYDHFQTTDEAINTRLMSPAYGIDVHDKGQAEKIGFVKTQIQHELARAQEANNGKPLSLEERDAAIDGVLKNTIDPRKERFLGFMPFTGENTSIPAHDAGVPASIAGLFQKAAGALDPDNVRSGDSKKQIKGLTAQYEDYQSIEPYVESAWNVQRGKNATPDDAVRTWYYARANWKRFEGVLRSSGAFVEGDESLNRERIVNLAVREILGMGR